MIALFRCLSCVVASQPHCAERCWAFNWSSRIFRHLIALPAVYFERRHTGDVLSRFGSGQAIQSSLSTQLIEAVLDGVMSFFALFLMLAYSVHLTLIVVATVGIACVVRFAIYLKFKHIIDEQLHATAREQSHFLETVRGIVPIKLFGAEANLLVRRASAPSSGGLSFLTTKRGPQLRCGPQVFFCHQNWSPAGKSRSELGALDSAGLIGLTS